MTHSKKNTTFIPAMVELARASDKTASTHWLSDYRKAKIDTFEQAEFPHKHIEHFKYNRFDAFDNQCFDTIPGNVQIDKDITTRAIPGLTDNGNVDLLVFINGQLQLHHSQLGNHKITPFADANYEQQQKILKQLTASDNTNDSNPFTQLNACLTNNGVLVEIDDTSPDHMIEILNIIDEQANNATLASQLVVDVADNSKATLVSRSLNWSLNSPNKHLSTQRTLVNVGKNAQVTHYVLQLENANSVHFGSDEYHLQSNAMLKAFYGATGGVLKKMDITVNHLGQHAHAFIDGLYAATGTQQIDYHTTINHPLPNGQTDEVFRGIVNDQAEAVFNGRIHIFEDAQKTRAELSNKNLILSDDAIIHTKPELEIYADDVVCAHGATVSRMNDESLNYLRARAIPKTEAELMLSYGFFNEVLEGLAHPAIADYLRPILFKRLS